MYEWDFSELCFFVGFFSFFFFFWSSENMTLNCYIFSYSWFSPQKGFSKSTDTERT